MPRRSALRLWLYGLGMLVPMVYFAWRYPLPGNSQVLTDIGKLAQYGFTEFVGFVGGMALLFGLYGLALRESRRLPARRALPAVFGCGAALAATMAAMYPVNAIDIFIYAVRSRLFTAYGANPIAAFPRDFPDDPWLYFASPQWARQVSPYGPLWNLIAAPITALAGDRIALALVGFKSLALLALLAGGWVIARTLRATPAATPATGALCYLWNPLVLWEGVGNGHNDVVMTLPLLLAIYAWAKRRDTLVIPLLVVGALIKYVTVLLLPLAALALWRRAERGPARWRLVLWSATLSGLATIIAFYPFYDLAAVRASIARQSDIFLASPATMVIGLLRGYYPIVELKQGVKLVGTSILLIALAWHVHVVWKRPSRLPWALFEVLYIFLLVATWNFRGWYLIWPVGLAALLPWGWPAWRILAWTAGAMAGYAFFIWIEAWWSVDAYTDHYVGVPIIFGATVLITLAEFVCYLRSGGRADAEAITSG